MILCRLAFTVLLAPAPTTAPDPLEGGRALTQSFYKGELDAIWPRFSPEMKQHLGNVEKLRAFHAGVKPQIGEEQEVVDEKVDTSVGTPTYIRTARFAKVPELVEVSWTIEPSGTITSFWIRPKLQEAATDKLGYVTKAPLRLPFRRGWFVFWGGRTLAQNYHAAAPDQRFAYDFVMRQDGHSHADKGARNEDYYAFDQEILAPADGRVVATENAVEDNVPGVMNRERKHGNYVVLDHGGGEFSVLCHFRKGTVAVAAGDTVKSGQVLGRCGNSGNSSEPHLHYHLQDSADLQNGRGLPPRFLGYQADGALVEAGEPVRGQTIEAAK